MPQVPTYGREERLNGAARPYEFYHLNGYMFGQGQAQAMANAGQGLNQLAQAAFEINDTIERTKGIEFNNAIEKWKQDNLLDKENGYFSKQGADAAGKSNEIIQNYDDFVAGWLKENKMSKRIQTQLQTISTQKRTGILSNTTAHDLEETNRWADTEGKLGIENAISNIVTERNNPDGIKTQLQNIRSITQWKGELQKLDAKTIELQTRDNISQALCAILDTKLQESPVDAKGFFNEHKEDINSNLHSKYLSAINQEERKYQAREMASTIINKYTNEQDAIKAAEAIKDVDMSDAVLSRVKRHYSQEEHFKDLQQRESLDNFYNKAVQAAQNGTSLSYDDIPDDLDPQMKLSLMNYVNTNGQPETDNQIWETLYNMSVNNAQGFVNEDLNKYRGFLSDSEYKSFLNRQQDIKSGNFYTTIKDDDKKIDAALKAMGLSGNTSVFGLTGKNKDIAYSEIRAMTRELEARKGRKITDSELESITNSLGYKGKDGVQLYKQLEKGMREKVGFIRDVMNDFTYYQTKHNGEMPSDEEKMKIITNRLNMKAQEKKTQAQQNIDNIRSNATTMRNIAYTVPKPNEQKVLTYFADNQIPTIGKQLNLRLTVTSRFRNDPNSKHGEGRAADVSMSEHNVQNRIKIYEKMLALPTVQAIGTSDPNILVHFKGNPKIVDERKYDRQHGTNHVNHAHVTLFKLNPATPAKVAQSNTYKF